MDASGFGYKTLVVVEGQKIPEDCPLTIMFVPTDPVEVIFKLYENVLRFYPDMEQKNYCLDKLEEVLQKHNKWLEESEGGKLSILTLLMLRMRQILKDNGREVSEPVLPQEETQLRQIAGDLLSDETTLIQRCPY